MEYTREQIKFTTPQGKELIIKTYVTPDEQRAIDRVYGENQNAPNLFHLLSDEQFRQVVISWDGMAPAEALPALCSSQPKSELKFIMKKCGEITKDTEESDPSEPQSSTLGGASAAVNPQS